MAARKTKTTEVSKASDDISRFRLGELGSHGLPIFNGVSNTELKKELNHPNSVKTYKLMSYHPSVNAPLSMYDNIVSKARPRFLPPKDATEEEKNQTKIVEEMFNDMEHSFDDFVAEAMSMTKYGWSVIEKVFRKRTYATGSQYNDGLIGLKKLPLRAQESISKFVFDEQTGNELIGVEQNLSGLSDPYNRYYSRKESDIRLPRSKFLLFALGNSRQNPFGESPLRNVYVPWKYLQALEELEAQSIVKDINGLPLLSVPPQYMSTDATDEQKATYAYFQNLLRNLQQGSQSAAIIPSFYDPDTRQPMFKLELLSQDGKKNFDLNKVKEYYRTMIFIGMNADILLMGSTAAGSFALGSIKNSLAANTAKVYSNRIAQVINEDLIRHLYELNGWNPVRRCKFDFEDIDEVDLDVMSKFYQRVGAVGYLPKTPEVVSRALTAIGLDALPEGITQEELEELLPEKTSRSGDGMEEGMGSGTGEAVSDEDNSAMNSDNAA